MAKAPRLLTPTPVEVSLVKTCARHTFRLARRLATASSAAPGYTRVLVREIPEAWRLLALEAEALRIRPLGERRAHVR